ncbi:MAG: DMT family transporter [Melioribacteraceae bacterium]|nr:DMT family transporter [Melioribacteraceae bacterium]
MLLALLVTFLWSTSFVIIKLGLKEIPPLTFAGLRYFIAFIALMPFILRKEKIEEIKSLDRKTWFKLIALGIIFYTTTQGTQFIGLSLLPSVTVSLWLNFTPIIVALLGIVLLSERPSLRQWFGTTLFIIGILVYFFPVSLSTDQTLGLAVMTIGVLANSGSAILGRDINRSGKHHPLIVTVISMGIGAILLLVIGISVQGLPPIGLTNLLYILWLALINTAFAFTLWNLSLRSLTAMESSIINGTMLIQIAILAWIFLGESISLKEIGGMLIAIAGALLVQIKKTK